MAQAPTQTEKFRNQYRVQSTRLESYDYSQNGAYFVTICTRDKRNIFGKIIGHQYAQTTPTAEDDFSPSRYRMQFTTVGKIACDYWRGIPKFFPFVILGEWVVMPNHLHGIVFIEKDLLSNPAQENAGNAFMPQSNNLASIVRGFKSAVTSYARKHTDITNVWQARFYDRIIRNEEECNKIAEYIITNPANWRKDDYYC